MKKGNLNLGLSLKSKNEKMNRKRIFSIVFVFMFILVSFLIGAQEAKNSPVAISPGSDTEVASIWQSCPTFSWSAVVQASSYRITVFEVFDPQVIEYEDMTAMASPVIIKDISGPALSWTLSSEESLKTESMYAWYVQAMDAYGNPLGSWSGGKIFKVEQEVRFAGIEEKLVEKLRAYGVDEETITNVLTDMKSDVKEVVVRSARDNNTPNRSVVLGYEGTTNTFYGLQAGYSTTGNYNTFIGRSAGYQNTTGFNNTFVGHFSGFSNSSGSFNTFLGVFAGDSNTTGFNNTFIGGYAGHSTTTGYNNSFFGQSAGCSNTIGHSNTFLGNEAGKDNTEGYENTFIGRGAGSSNTTGNANTFLGFYAGSSNNTGNYNTLIGYAAGNSNTSGRSNTFIGHEAGKVNTVGNYNVLIGHEAGKANTSGKNNTFIGYGAGKANTTGYQNIFVGKDAGRFQSTGNDNIFIGNWAGGDNTKGVFNAFLGNGAGRHNTTGNSNVFLGHEAGYYSTTGGSNTILGNYAGFSNTTGNENTFIGNGAGNYNTTGNNNTFLGNCAGFTSTTGIGNVFLGYQAGFNETGSNKLYIANSDTISPLIYGEFDNNIVTVNGRIGINTKTPDFTLEVVETGTKSCIVVRRTDGATNYINATSDYANFGCVTNHPLRLVVNSTWKMRLNQDGSLVMANGATCTTGGVWTDASSRALKENIENLSTDEAFDAFNKLIPVKYNYKIDKTDKHVGFIAEDVPELVATVERKGLSPMDITAVLTSVVKEQQKMIREQQKVSHEYKKIIADLQERLAKIEKER